MGIENSNELLSEYDDTIITEIQFIDLSIQANQHMLYVIAVFRNICREIINGAAKCNDDIITSYSRVVSSIADCSAELYIRHEFFDLSYKLLECVFVARGE